MNITDLSTEKPIVTDGHSSKGNQSKWRIGNLWYKADHMGYEGLSEVIVSRMLLKITGIREYVKYEPVMIKYGDKTTAGCVSRSFLMENEELIPFERLYRSYTGKGLAGTLSGISGVSEKIAYTADFISDITGLHDAGRYIADILELDAFFLNEDRHTNNLAVIRNSENHTYRFAPVFDNGLALLSDMNDYPLDKEIGECTAKIEAKPFSRDFEEQADAAVRLYGRNFNFSFTKAFVNECIRDLNEYYPEEVLLRIEKVLAAQMRKYAMI